MHGVWEVMAQGGSQGFAGGIVALWVFSAAVSAMSVPTEKSGPGYQWLFRFAHLLAANLDRAGVLGSEVGEAAREPAVK